MVLLIKMCVPNFNPTGYILFQNTKVISKTQNGWLLVKHDRPYVDTQELYTYTVQYLNEYFQREFWHTVNTEFPNYIYS